MCARQTSFSAIFLLNKITAPKFINNLYSNQDLLLTLASTEVLNEELRFKLVSRVFLLFDINVKDRRNPGNEVAQSLNWTKESWDNALAQINSALIDFTSCFNVGNLCAILR